jgi:hypothetical protein
MANNSNVGKTVGIVLGITAAVGLGLYLILRPKTASANTPVVYSPTGSSSQVAELEKQIALLNAKQKSEAAFLSERQKAEQKAQLNALILQLGSQFASKGLDYWSSTWGNRNNSYNSQSTYLDTDYGTTAPDTVTDSVFSDSKYGNLFKYK